jgi:hypothetical protein
MFRDPFLPAFMLRLHNVSSPGNIRIAGFLNEAFKVQMDTIP